MKHLLADVKSHGRYSRDFIDIPGFWSATERTGRFRTSSWSAPFRRQGMTLVLEGEDISKNRICFESRKFKGEGSKPREEERDGEWMGVHVEKLHAT